MIQIQHAPSIYHARIIFDENIKERDPMNPFHQ